MVHYEKFISVHVDDPPTRVVELLKRVYSEDIWFTEFLRLALDDIPADQSYRDAIYDYIIKSEPISLSKCNPIGTRLILELVENYLMFINYRYQTVFLAISRLLCIASGAYELPSKYDLLSKIKKAVVSLDSYIKEFGSATSDIKSHYNAIGPYFITDPGTNIHIVDHIISIGYGNIILKDPNTTGFFNIWVGYWGAGSWNQISLRKRHQLQKLNDEFYVYLQNRRARAMYKELVSLVYLISQGDRVDRCLIHRLYTEFNGQVDIIKLCRDSNISLASLFNRPCVLDVSLGACLLLLERFFDFPMLITKSLIIMSIDPHDNVFRDQLLKKKILISVLKN